MSIGRAKQILIQVWKELDDDNVGIVAAGVAFYSFLALFPALAALMSIYGLLFDPGHVPFHLRRLRGIVPQEAIQLATTQLEAIVGGSSYALTAGAVFAILVALFSAKKGMSALMNALHITYDADGFGYFKGQVIAYLLVAGAVLFGVVTLGVLVLLPPLLAYLRVPAPMAQGVLALRWPALAVLMMIALHLLYSIGARQKVRAWRTATPGAVTATLLWLSGSGAFSYFSANFGSYHETYGSLGAVVISMLWLSLSAYVVLLGAELNHAIQRTGGTDLANSTDHEREKNAEDDEPHARHPADAGAERVRHHAGQDADSDASPPESAGRAEAGAAG